ncbi:type 1 glutamine amidotransferase domain-containing protein [Govanella unica]|uniref:Type 1 glutamine amidotransferase domain-containing protein n=1 Tax=Govanella unica TaxID=2975056 RepID=A0A9X3Z7Y9_9PROT|nr:type 1 glutamine amidotransferase domain-containing protein [Govania unica]MDA5194538.1 type 1 glutamine amidotransferase domain-containing protein [Govania unica]
MSKHILFILTSHATLGSSGRKTGSWLEELAAVYNRLTDAGHRVTFASPAGGAAPIDPMSLEDTWVTPDGQRFLANAAAQQQVAGTVKLSDVDIDQYDGLFLVGGTGTVWDFPHDADLKRYVESLYVRNAVLAGICHGVIGLAFAIDHAGQPILRGRKATCISNAEDDAAGLIRLVPVLPEDMLRKMRAFYSAAAPFRAHTVVDGQFFTGQNPASAAPLGDALVEHFASVPA